MTEQYVIGIDGGGTKTLLKAVLDSGQELFCTTGGPLNICSTTKEKISETLTTMLSEMLKSMDGEAICKGICIGAAGLSNQETEPFLRSVVANVFPNAPLHITSDADIGLCGALGQEWGIILIVGTGSICYGHNIEGKHWQCGGAGHLLEDEGSGYAIGRDILRAVLRNLDGRENPTVLMDLLAKEYGMASRESIVDFTYAHSSGWSEKAHIASLAPLLGQACDQGDKVALEIARNAAMELYALAIPVIRMLELESGPLSLAGSILIKEKYVRQPLSDLLFLKYPGMKIIQPIGQPVDGALMLAKKL